MSGKWAQAENGKGEKLDVYVWVENPPRLGTVAHLGDTPEVVLLGPDGKPLKRRQRRRIGFQR